MNDSERRVLKLLSSRDSSALALARHLEQDAGRVERMCERLVSEGLATADNGDPVTYQITDAGRDALDRRF